MRSERIGDSPACDVARRWLLAPRLAVDLQRLDSWMVDESARAGVSWPGLWIISGHRPSPVAPSLSPGTPAAEQSLHLECPSLAADLRVGNQPASQTPLVVWGALGAHWQNVLGHRWGGGFEPPDPNHFDMGQPLYFHRTVGSVGPPTSVNAGPF